MSLSLPPEQPTPSPGSRPAEAAPVELPLERVLVTERLAQRPARPADHAAENRALLGIAHAVNGSPIDALERLMREAVALCRPDGNATAGVSLLEHDASTGAEVFRWTAMAGRLANHVGKSTPREFSPCGVCLDQEGPVLFDRPDLRFTYFLETEVEFVEGLVLPFHVDGKAAGTIWIVSHDESRTFDGEDVRIMTSLAGFTGAAYTLIRARERAERASGDREALLHTIAHEWLTPVTTIVAVTAVVADETVGPVTDTQRDLLNRARAAAHHLNGLLKSALAQARIEPGSVASRTERLDMYAIVRETTAMVESSARDAGLTLEVQSASKGVTVEADAIRVRQILLNLLGNAVKYTDRGGVYVSLEAAQGGVRVKVRDTGPGIAPESMQRIFDRHWRAQDGDAPRSERARQGLGLGLAISRELARQMGGDIVVESEPGRGSTFTFLLNGVSGAA